MSRKNEGDAMTSADSLVQCSVCKRQEVVDFGTCLRSGWPKCHGYTMTLLHTTADIDKAVGSVFEATGKWPFRPEAGR